MLPRSPLACRCAPGSCPAAGRRSYTANTATRTKHSRTCCVTHCTCSPVNCQVQPLISSVPGRGAQEVQALQYHMPPQSPAALQTAWCSCSSALYVPEVSSWANSTCCSTSWLRLSLRSLLAASPASAAAIAWVDGLHQRLGGARPGVSLDEGCAGTVLHGEAMREAWTGQTGSATAADPCVMRCPKSWICL